MANVPYGLGDLRFADRKFKCATGTEEISFSVFGGSLRIGVNKTGEWKAFWSQTLNPIRQRILWDHINSLISKSPGTKDPIIFSRWDNEQKKQVPEWGIELQKDEKLVYHIVVNWKGNRYDAPIRGAYGVSFGSDNISEADASFYGIDDLRNWLNTTVPLQMVLTNKRREQNGGGSNGGARNNGGSNGGAAASDDYF